MTDKERELRIKACQADERAQRYADAANGDWFNDPINYFAAISEREAAKKYLAEAEAIAAKNKESISQ